MRFALVSIVAVVGLLALVGCEDDNSGIFDPVPAAPQGVYSVTGDHAVDIFWNGPYETDIVEFIIWRSNDSLVNYGEIGRSAAEPNPDLRILWVYKYTDTTAENGVKYFYAVSSVDQRGQVSDLSAESVFDTPRPEGWVELYDSTLAPDSSGWHFSTYHRVAPSLADVFVDRVGDIFYLNAGNDQTDLQDVGYTYEFEDVGWAPQDGWSDNGWAEIILGHTYVIWTHDLRFAKMRVESISDSTVAFRWAYQTAENNPELIVRPDSLEKPVRGPEYLQKKNPLSSLK